MSKRFTDTEKWKDEWFADLDPEIKLFYLYILDTCDHAGVWKVNFRLAEFSMGVKIDKDAALKSFNGRVIQIGFDKWCVTKFITFQYGKTLNLRNNSHRGALKLLEFHGLETSSYAPPSKPQEMETYDSLAHKDQDQIQVQDQVMDQDQENSYTENAAPLQSSATSQKTFGLTDCFQLWEDLGSTDYPELVTAKILPWSCAPAFANLKSRYLPDETAWRGYFIGLAKTEFGDKKNFSLNTALSIKTYENFQNGVYGLAKTSDPMEMFHV